MISENLAELRRRIEAACRRAGRRTEEVTLVAISKTFPAAAIDEAVRAGVLDIGENRVQEMKEKLPLLEGKPRLHLVGHLQSNKAKDAARIFDVIQSVDDPALAAKLDREAGAAGRRLEILVQVNIGEEPQKSGVLPGDAAALVRAASALPNLTVTGLMSIPPALDAEGSRPYHRALRELRDRIREETALPLPQLSMGMSEDFEVAIEEGATMVRLGRAVFGKREV